jgi:hypothetical protein
MWTRKTDHIIPDNNPGVKIFDLDVIHRPAISIEQNIAPVDDRSGGLNINIRRTGGNPGNAVFLEYHVDALMSDGFDVADTVIVEADNMTGGAVFAKWTVAASPANPDAIGIIVGEEVNILERRGDQGLKLTRDGKTSVIHQLIPVLRKAITYHSVWHSLHREERKVMESQEPTSLYFLNQAQSLKAASDFLHTEPRWMIQSRMYRDPFLNLNPDGAKALIYLTPSLPGLQFIYARNIK